MKQPKQLTVPQKWTIIDTIISYSDYYYKMGDYWARQRLYAMPDDLLRSLYTSVQSK